jgi:transcription-repair coupling factor (superfamily II helicase)
VRLALYRGLADMEEERDIDSFAAEMVDRFGPLPQEVEHLMQIVQVKAYCRRANVDKLDAGPKGAVLSFRDNTFVNPDGLFTFIREQGAGVKMRNDKNGQKLVFLDEWDKPEERLKGTLAIVRRLASIANRAKAA